MRHCAHPRVFRAPGLTTRSYAPLSRAPTIASTIPGCHQSTLLRYHGRQVHLSASAPRLSAAPQPQPGPSEVDDVAYNGRPLQSSSAPFLSPSAANPPATTRPPPLELPARKPETSTFSHLLATAKVYLTFYKTGLRSIYTNTRLLWSVKPGDSPESAGSPRLGPHTRANLLLQSRWRHDARRVPLFALMLLICGEFTPFVVLAIPRVAPLTCRIPAQVDRIYRDAESRRRRSAEAFQARAAATGGEQQQQKIPYGLVVGHLARSLGVVSSLWDRLGWVPGTLAGRKVGARLRYLAVDDALLVQAGGVPALEPEEVVLACVDRGIDTLARPVGELSDALTRWLSLTDSYGLGPEESTRRMAVLLMQREQDWPSQWPEDAAGQARGW